MTDSPNSKHQITAPEKAEAESTALALLEAESAVITLQGPSPKPAVLLAREWHVLGVPFEFEHLDLFKKVAAEAHYFIVTTSRPEAGGLDHMLFITSEPQLADREYFSCIDEPTASAKDAI